MIRLSLFSRVAALSLFLFLGTNTVVADPSDLGIQSDGLSDLIVIEDGTRQLRWKVLSSHNQFASIAGLGTFGPKGSVGLGLNSESGCFSYF